MKKFRKDLFYEDNYFDCKIVDVPIISGDSVYTVLLGKKYRLTAILSGRLKYMRIKICIGDKVTCVSKNGTNYIVAREIN